MKRYFVGGRVIPERLDLSMQAVNFNHEVPGGGKFQSQIYVARSKICAHITADDTIDLSDIRNNLFSALGKLVNYFGFQRVMGLSYELDTITELDLKWTHLSGVEGYVFDEQSNSELALTFKSAPSQGTLPVSLALIDNNDLGRATFELRNSIRYPDFTALHCRLAIEAIRNHFDEKEDKAWPKLRAALNVTEATLREFEEVSSLQRHGRNQPQTWEQRRRCMQIAWEVAYRFTQLLNNDPALKNAPAL